MTDSSSSPRPRRELRDLSNIFDSIDESKLTPLLDMTRKKASTSSTFAVQSVTDSGVTPSVPSFPKVSPALKTYLPPDLWRKISSDTPRSGIYINALERLNSLLYTISTYLPADLVQEKLNHPVPGLVDGKILSGCLLFSDVSGFTALSEKLAGLGPQGAEYLTGFINQYFSTMIDIIAWSNGILVKFAGDATLIYFPEQENGDHVRWAARAGLRMLRAMSEFSNIPTPLGPVKLSMKLGMAAGSFLAASIGSAKRMEYALIGDVVAQTLQAEGNSAPGLLVMNQVAADVLSQEYQLSDVKPGFFLLKADLDNDVLDTFEIRPEKRRARRTTPWDASLDELNAELESALDQIQALVPYLASELLDRIVTHAYQRQVQSEYRPTVVMFCNFTGPENLLALWGDSGSQRVTGLLSSYFNDMHEAISHFGGIVSRIDPYSKGTKLLALFGAPVAHEDDPQRAVSAALAMNAALQAINRRWMQKLARHMPPEGGPETLIQHRIGITLGETFAGQAGSPTRREYTVMGDEVNLAARLMSTAVSGQILISEPMLERVKPYFVTRKLPPVRVKGKKKPIPIWQVDGPREDTLLSRIQMRSPLIGRAFVFSQARLAFERARAGMGGILFLTGLAGIGKSHLADILLREASASGWQTQVFQCRSYQAEDAFSCWTGLLRSLAGITLTDHPLIQVEKLERLAAELNLVAVHETTLNDVLGLRQVHLNKATEGLASGDDLFKMVKQKKASRKASRLDVFDQLDGIGAATPSATTPLHQQQTVEKQAALQATLMALSTRAPLVIFFEDSHWMDVSSRETLLTLNQKLSGYPILFLLAGRQYDALPEPVETIVLAPFSREETNAMAAAILTEGLTDIIHEQSNGSPLFIEEISGWIKRTYHIDQAGVKSVLQSSDILQKLVLSTLESLPEAQREVMRLASVVGVEFRRSEVEALADGLDPVTLSNYLHSLTQSSLIDLSEAGVDRRYTFEQTIFRDIIYTSLPFERRRDLHALMASYLKNLPSRRRQLRDKIAAFLDDGPSSNPLRDAEKLAFHYEMSEQWLDAAQQLIDVVGHFPPEQTGTEPLLSRALAFLEKIPPETADRTVDLQKARAYLGLGDKALRQGELPAAAAAYESALSLLPAEPFSVDLASHLTMGLALVWPSQGKTAQVEKQLGEFIENHPKAELWKFYILLAWLAWREKRDVTPLAVAARQLLLPELDSRTSLRANTLLDDLQGLWAQAIPNYQLLGEADCAALAHIRQGDDLLRRGNLAEADEQYNRASEIWQKTHSSCGLALVAYRQAELNWLVHRDTHKTLALLEESLARLVKSPPALQTGPRVVVQNALARIKKQQEGSWQAWQWQPYDDLARIHLLLPIFQRMI